jgi:6-phosphogluconolactonase (cycloisomerase 2 family)
MANLNPKNLYIGNESGVAAYTVANTVGNYTIIKNINLCNTTSSNAVCSIHILKDSESAVANNKIVSNVNVLANNVVYYNTSIVMPANSKLHIAQVTANAITFTISGVEYA